MNFLFICKRLLFWAFFFLSFELGGACSISEWPSLLTYLTLFSTVVLHNVIYVKKVCDEFETTDLEFILITLVK